jgi:preprotein translocase subunit SecE
MQAARLYYRKEQKEHDCAAGVEKVLPVLSQAYRPPRNKVTMPSQKGKDVARVRQEVIRENRLARFGRETLAELRKVVWPTRAQAVNLTIIVVVTVVAMSSFLGVIDLVLTAAVRLILAR